MNATAVLEEAKRLKAIADTGLLYATNPYDRERYEELQALALRLLRGISGHDDEVLKAVFPTAADHPTAKVDVRALVLSGDKKILLVKEAADGRWALPGGWADVGYSPAETAVKECFEEAGLRVKARTLLAVFDKKKHPHPPQVAYVYKLVFFCEAEDEVLAKGFEVLDAAYFNINALPPLSEDRILRSQIELVYGKALAGDSTTYFD